MIFSCEREGLTEAISIVQRAISSKTTNPILEGIHIKAVAGKIILTGNDNEIGIEAVVESAVEKDGTIVVNSRLFGDIIRKMTGDIVYINVNEGSIATIKCGISNFNINGIIGGEFPEIPKFPADFEIILTKSQLRDLVKHTIFSVGTSDTKLILTGCLLEANQNMINMVAVDGFRMAYKKIITEQSVLSGTDQAVSIVIPSKALNEINRSISDSDDNVIIKCSQKNISFEFDNILFTARLLEGQFIDYEKIIPLESSVVVKVSAVQISNAVERASLIIISEIAKSPLIMNINNSTVKIDCETTSGKVEELIPVEMTGDSLEIGFNNRFLQEALRAVDCSEIKMSFNSPVSPCLIEPAEGENFKYVILPVRLKT